MKATVIVPTTGDRAPLLPYSIGSILRQTLTDLEVFVIGDGLDDATRRAILDLQAHDPRIRLFDHPKHPRRGEVYRHAALAEARGEIVCYLCDRDLMLPGHVGQLYHYLQTSDFVSTPHYRISRAQEVAIGGGVDPFYGRVGEGSPAAAWSAGHQLSSVGHSLAAYRRLPHGWRTTPEDQYTDRYMWAQFMDQPALKIYHAPHPTILYFKRGDFPGWPVSKREPELRHWAEVISEPAHWAALADQAHCDLFNAHLFQQSQLSKTLLLKGRTITEYWRGFLTKLSR